MRFFKKIQDWILKSEIIRKRILRFFTQQINPRSFGSWCLTVPLIHHDPRDLGLICSVKKRKIRFRILSDLRIQSWIFLKKRTLSNYDGDADESVFILSLCQGKNIAMVLKIGLLLCRSNVLLVFIENSFVFRT